MCWARRESCPTRNAGRSSAGVLAAAGDLPVCVGVTHAATDRAIAYAREAADSGCALGHARASGARAPERRRGPRPLSRGRRRGRPPGRRPGPPGEQRRDDVGRAAHDDRGPAPNARVIKLEDEPSPPKIGRLLAARADLRILGGLGAIMLLEELRRGAVGTMTGFGFPELLVDIVGRYRAGDEAGARETSIGSCRSSGSRTSPASTSPSASTSTSVAAPSRRPAPGTGSQHRCRHHRRPRAHPRERRPRGTGSRSPAEARRPPDGRYGNALIIPPSTGTMAPVTYDAAGDSRNVAEASELERVAVAPQRDALNGAALDLLDRDAARGRARSIELGDPVRPEPAGREAVDPDRGDLLDQRLDRGRPARAG